MRCHVSRYSKDVVTMTYIYHQVSLLIMRKTTNYQNLLLSSAIQPPISDDETEADQA